MCVVLTSRAVPISAQYLLPVIMPGLLTHPIGDAFRGHGLPVLKGYLLYAGNSQLARKGTRRKIRQSETDPEVSRIITKINGRK